MSKQRPIIVVGSLNADLAVQAERFPVAGETLRGRSFSVTTGGKGANQAAAAARLGYPTRMVGRVGEDSFAAGVLQDLAEAGVLCDQVRAIAGSTGAALITKTGDGANTIVIAPGANDGLTPEAIEEAWPTIAEAGMVLAQLEGPLETVIALAERCAAAGVRLMLDPAPAQSLPADLLRQVTWLTPNESEAESLSGTRVAEADEETLRRVADGFLKQGVGNLALKLGARGVYLATADEQRMIAGLQVATVDTTAAGDCFNGALAVALLRGEPPAEAARFAVAAAALSTTRLGALASMPSLLEVSDLLGRREGR